MIISVVNHAANKVTDEAVQQAIRAINRQIKEDFHPFWGMDAELRLEGRVGEVPDRMKLPELRGDAILYLWDKQDEPEALGYHEANNKGIPYSFVLVDDAEAKGADSWTVTFSHEALEMIADPEANLTVAGPDPNHPNTTVYHWYEMCDAVQGDSYTIDGVEVSNFVLPLYFTTRAEEGGRNDFLGKQQQGKGLASFGIRPGGYIGYIDPLKPKEVGIYTGRADDPDALALKDKVEAKIARKGHRLNRYMRHLTRPDLSFVERQDARRIRVLFVHGLNTDEIDEADKTEENITSWLQHKLSDTPFAIEEVDYLNYNELFARPEHQLALGEFLDLAWSQKVELVEAICGVENMAQALLRQDEQLFKETLTAVYEEFQKVVRQVVRFTGFGRMGRQLGTAHHKDSRLGGLYHVFQLMHHSRQALRDEVVALLKHRTAKPYDLIITHSFGSLISFYGFQSDAAIGKGAAYLTIGSQISQQVFNQLYNRGSNLPTRPYPAQLKCWVNLYNPQDLVYVKEIAKTDIIPNERFTPLTVDMPGVRTGFAEEHDLAGYLNECLEQKVLLELLM